MSHAFDLIRFRIHKRRYSSIRAIMSELGQSDTVLLRGLRELHGIYFDFKDDPELWLTEDTHQLEILASEGVTSPTMLQVALTSKAWSDLSENDVKERWKKAMEAVQDAEPKIITG